MTPIEQWRDAKNREIMAGGKPTHCIMGSNAFDVLCGAIGVFHNIDGPVGMNGVFEYEGITVRKSRSVKWGMLFG